MVLTQRGLAGAAVVAIGLIVAPCADAGWLGFGNKAQQPGGGGVTLAQVDPSRVDQLENTVRRLTGQIETLQHQVDELTQALQKMQADNEYRFGQLEGGNGGGGQRAASAAPPEPAPAPADNSVAAAPADNGGQQQLGAPPRSLGTLTLSSPPSGNGEQPLDLSALARGDSGAADAGGGAPAAGVDQVGPPTGDPVADYKTAYELYVSGQYAAADKAFRQFLNAYPGDPRAENATYWLGQSLFSRGMFREAAVEFVNSYKAYPKSQHAADTLLLLGKSLAGIPQREAACQTFAEALKKYPSMSNALRQRFITEQANAGC